jgi:hypothetical protein
MIGVSFISHLGVCALVLVRGHFRAGTDGGIRTHTERVLSAPPLPLGYISQVLQSSRCGWNRTTMVRRMRPASSKERSDCGGTICTCDLRRMRPTSYYCSTPRWRLTRIELASSGCKPDALPLSYSPKFFAITSRCGYRESHTVLELGTLASCYWTMAAESPSSELHRSLPFTKRLLDSRAARAKETRSATSARSIPGSSGRIRTSIFPINNRTPYR